MNLKILQLNIEGGRKLDELVAFVKQEDFDVVILQEVASGTFSRTGKDTFNQIKEATDYEGILAKSTVTIKDGQPSYFANATFYKPSLTVLDQQIIWLKPYKEFVDPPEKNPEFIINLPHNALAVKFGVNDKSLWVINTHLAWGPNPKDEPYKIDQARILESFVKELELPFLLSGDFNVTPNSEIVKAFDTLAFNQVVAAEITNTLNPRLHKAQQLFPAGLTVDYIYTSRDLEAKNFRLVSDPDLSDHYGLSIEVII